MIPEPEPPMLAELVVEGLGVIERAEMSLEAGCSVLTGETGAGKTLVVAAVGLLLGDRADKSLVRDGHSEARVEGRWLLPPGHSAVTTLTDEGLVEPDDADGEVELVVSRAVPSDGRSGRARINGRLASMKVLAEVGSMLVEIAGQHEHQRLGSSTAQRELLDAFAGADALAAARELRVAVRAMTVAARAAEELEEGARARRREADVLEYEIDEIEKAAVTAGESSRLTSEASRLEHAEEIAIAVSEAVGHLKDEGGAHDLLSRAESAVSHASGKDPALEELAKRLAAAMFEIDDVAEDLASRVVPADSGVLEETLARLDVLSRLRRKYGRDELEVLQYLDRARSRLGELRSDDSEIERRNQERAEHEGRARDLARRLSDLRTAAAPRLQRAMEELLSELALGGARFVVELSERPLYEGGVDGVVFLISANPGESPRSISKVASGGELSRIALGLHLLTSTGNTPTMVFDEVDAGVGGKAAQSVGRSLAALARSSKGQVIVVTHLPQVAAFADHHYAVGKTSIGGRNQATVTRLHDEDRVTELSRMLAGLPESERAREHAQELLEMAAGAGE